MKVEKKFMISLRSLLSAALLSMVCTSQLFAQEPVKVLSWNLEHFVDPMDDPYVENSLEDQGEWKGDKAMKNLALAIKKIDADVIAFQEVEGDRQVKLFLDTMLPDHDYNYFAGVPSIQWYQNTAIASKFPIGRITSWREAEMFNPVINRTENKYNNRLSAAEIIVDEDYRFQLVNVHFKAGGDREDPIWRTKQIELLQDWFVHEAKADPEVNIMVIGDTNMVPGSPEHVALVEDEDHPFFDPADEQGHPPTHPSDNPRRRIDQVFLNMAMQPEYVENSTAVAQPLSMQELADISDHLPVVISIFPEDQ